MTRLTSTALEVASDGTHRPGELALAVWVGDCDLPGVFKAVEVGGGGEGTDALGEDSRSEGGQDGEGGDGVHVVWRVGVLGGLGEISWLLNVVECCLCLLF